MVRWTLFRIGCLIAITVGIVFCAAKWTQRNNVQVGDAVEILNEIDTKATENNTCEFSLPDGRHSLVCTPALNSSPNPRRTDLNESLAEGLNAIMRLSEPHADAFRIQIFTEDWGKGIRGLSVSYKQAKGIGCYLGTQQCYDDVYSATYDPETKKWTARRSQ